ncbi:chromosome condensation complex Condensin, subunit G [Coniosporium tulheliwenetii]|uniref:Chromosome condensation complex Condensin, subunit G n=1 Tax=Coniosporium tulheliwenetii TaxID=3383036 RepID=A0ACC2YY68_9PEZI|nr:chromosome condensation complex Condensin, subunit G [Cladosporium sp. JES 115]
MPGRVSARSQRSSGAVSRKSSTATLKSRASSTRTSAHAVELPDEGPTTSLREQICAVFADAQRTTATQRKLVISLRKVQEACCYEPVKPKKRRDEEDFGEDEFNEEVGRCFLRVLGVKKSEPVGDRIVRFLGLFLKVASEKDNQIASNGDPEATSFPETPTTRLTSLIISLVLPLLTAKDKVVRFRATQIISHIINTLDSIDDELFQLIRLGLLKRLRDKEPSVRVQAVLGLGRLAGEGDEEQDDEDSDDDTAGGVLEKLVDVLQNDPSAEVRRSLLLNLPFTPATLPYLLERARDLDAGTRRALYARLLPALGDFRHLSLTHREKLLRWGLRDRDENVRKATARLFRERWIEDCAGLQQLTEEGAAPAAGQVSKPSYEALLELLERVDVVNSGVEGGIALEAMKEFWDGRPDYREFVTFEDQFWDELTPEAVFVARTFNDYCRAKGEQKLMGMLEDKMPEVTKFAFFLQGHLNRLMEGVQQVALQAEEDAAEAEEDTVQQEFCVEQMLHIALSLDYSDEVGRRKMFSIMREALALAELPEECTKLVIEVLRTVCGANAAGEREFCGIVLEAVAEVHDTIMGEEAPRPDAASEADESFHSATSHLSSETTPTKPRKSSKHKAGEEEVDDEEKAIREIMVNMKCLHIAQCMLQNVQCDLEENSDLVTMLNNLVVPAVRSQEAPIRERGLVCLGLCCLLSKNLAQENLTLFLHCFTKGHEALQTISLQIITDILTTHPVLLSPIPPPTDQTTTADATELQPPQPNPLLRPLQKTFLKALKSPSPTVQTTGTIALSKLLLLNVFRAAEGVDELLRHMTLLYFTPSTRQNPGMQQALSYFLPVYCHSRAANALRMARVAVGVVHALLGVAEEAEEEEEEMVGGGVVGGEEEGGEAHLLLAEELLEKVCMPGTLKEEKKIYFSMLSKLHITTPTTSASASASSSERLAALTALLDEATEAKVATDATSRNALARLRNAVWKLTESGFGGDATVVGNGSEDRAKAKDREETDKDEMEEVEEGMAEITMADLDGEGTVMGEDDEEDEGTVVGRGGRGGESIVDSLLESEMDVA